MKFALAIHGGAGVIENLPIEEHDRIKTILLNIVKTGHKFLTDGGNAVDCGKIFWKIIKHLVTLVVSMLENEPTFNAGKGAVFNEDGKNYLEASIMTSELKCGAITEVPKDYNLFG